MLALLVERMLALLVGLVALVGAGYITFLVERFLLRDIIRDPGPAFPEWLERLSPLKGRWLAYAVHIPMALFMGVLLFIALLVSIAVFARELLGLTR
jgi:hypothetical protein